MFCIAFVNGSLPCSGALEWQIRKILIKLKLFCFEREDRGDRFGDNFFFLRLSLFFPLLCVCLASCISFSILLLFFTRLLCTTHTLLQGF